MRSTNTQIHFILMMYLNIAIYRDLPMLKKQLFQALEAICEALQSGSDVLIKLKKDDVLKIQAINYKRLATGQAETQTGEK